MFCAVCVVCGLFSSSKKRTPDGGRTSHTTTTQKEGSDGSRRLSLDLLSSLIRYCDRDGSNTYLITPNLILDLKEGRRQGMNSVEKDKRNENEVREVRIPYVRVHTIPTVVS